MGLAVVMLLSFIGVALLYYKSLLYNFIHNGKAQYSDAVQVRLKYLLPPEENYFNKSATTTMLNIVEKACYKINIQLQNPDHQTHFLNWSKLANCY